MNAIELLRPDTSREYERAVLGAVIVSPDEFATASKHIESEHDFRWPELGHVWRAISDAHDCGEPIDLVLLKDRLSESGRLEPIGGPAGLARLVEGIPRNASVAWYAEQVAERAKARRVNAALSAAGYAAHDGEWSRVEEHLEAATGELSGSANAEPSDGGELDLQGLTQTGEDPGPVPYIMADATGSGPVGDGDIVVLAGDGEAGKSTTALGLGLSLATGIPFADRFDIAEPMPVLYVDGENNERLIRRRWLRLVNGTPGAREAVMAWDSSQLRYRWRGNLTVDTKVGRDHIVNLCHEYGTQALFLDTQIRFTSGDLLNAKDAASVYASLSDIKRRADLRVVFMLAHLRKRQSGKGAVNDLGQRLFGSADIRNSCDCLIVLTKPPKGDAVTVVHDKTRWDEHYPNFAIELRQDGETARLVAGVAVNNPINSVRQTLEDVRSGGALGTELQESVSAAHPEMNDEAVRKAVYRELKSREYVSKSEGKTKRFWLRLYAPEDAA